MILFSDELFKVCTSDDSIGGLPALAWFVDFLPEAPLRFPEARCTHTLRQRLPAASLDKCEQLHIVRSLCCLRWTQITQNLYAILLQP